MSTRITTGKVRFSYVHIFKPYAYQPGQDEKYSICLLIPKKDEKTIRKIRAAINGELRDGTESRWGGRTPKNYWNPLRDGDEEKAEERPEYKGMYFLNAKSDMKPPVFDQDGEEILDPGEVYSGCWGKAIVEFYTFDNSGNKGVGVGLRGIKKTQDDEPLGGSARVTADDFDDEDDEDDF